MALANVALTDTFDYWRTVTNSLVVAINDKLVYCNTSNANTVSIPSFASRTSNLYVNIITSTSLNDTATSNVASAFTANTLQGLALVYAASANSNTQVSVRGANTWANTIGVASNNWANTIAFSTGISATAWANNIGASANSWANAVGAAANSYSSVTYAPKLSPTINNPTLTGTATINANIANQTLTDAATINWDVSLGSVATVTLAGNRIVAAPTNLKIGTYILHIIQDGVGSRTLTWNSIFKWPAGVAPVLTTTAGRRDLFSFVC
ncbi:hypothetical protein EB001_09880, partial [bacterium]|nr:hypothetical protein [bacterium]